MRRSAIEIARDVAIIVTCVLVWAASLVLALSFREIGQSFENTPGVVEYQPGDPTSPVDEECVGELPC